MQKRNKILLRSGLFSLVMMMGLASCGNNENSSQGGSSTGAIANLDSLADDLTLNDEGKVSFDEEVQLSVWCIIGDPDQKVYNELITKFNNEYSGLVHLNMRYVGHFDFYNNLDNTYSTDFKEGFPDVLVMHNEKTAEYANKGYLLPLDQIGAKTTVEPELSSVYENIDRVTKFNNVRYAIPMDAHGWVTSIRQDIIKKNGLGFDNNTHFIPNSREEYQTLLEKLREKADSNEGLLTRNLNKNEDHSWVKVNPDGFYPEFLQSTDPDGLSSLYANNGSLCSEDGETIKFHENKGFQTYITDQVKRYNSNLMGENGTDAEAFGKGNNVLFPQGPWWVSQTYSLQWNNSELRKAGEKGVTEEDATDPIYSKPYIASRPTGWWTIDENKSGTNANKWYGNGHAISLTKHITSAQKAAGAMTFINWFTQGKDDETGKYNLAAWCNSGHMPAYKNVFDSDEYKAYMESNLTLRALGDPKDVIAMEGLAQETIVFNALANAVSNVHAQLKTSKGCTEEKALEIVNASAQDGQTALNMTKLGSL